MEVYARMRAAIKRGHFWAYGPLVCTTAHGRALVFERRNFFSEAATALKAIPGGEATPDLSDLERGITTGHVLRKERYLEVSKFLYRALLAGTFAPRTSHTFSSGLTPQLLLDVFQAINFNNRSIWFEGRTLEARGQSMSVTVSHVRLPRLSRLFRLRPTSEIAFRLSPTM